MDSKCYYKNNFISCLDKLHWLIPSSKGLLHATSMQRSHNWLMKLWLNCTSYDVNLHHALLEVHSKGYYYTENVANTLLHSIEHKEKRKEVFLKGRELEFLKLTCTERTYKEIADIMCLSPKTVENYRESLFEKLNAKSRIGLVLFAIKEKIVIL